MQNDQLAILNSRLRIFDFLLSKFVKKCLLLKFGFVFVYESILQLFKFVHHNRPRSGFASMYSGGPVRATDRSLVPPMSDAHGHVPPIRKPYNQEPPPSPSLQSPLNSQRSGSTARLRDEVNRNRTESSFTGSVRSEASGNVEWAFSGPPTRPGWVDDNTEVINMDSPARSRPGTPQSNRLRAANSPPRRNKEIMRNNWGTPQGTPKIEPRSRPSSASKMRNGKSMSSKIDFTPSGGLFSDLELPSANNSARHNDSRRSEAESDYWCSSRVEYKPNGRRASSSRPGSAISNKPRSRPGSAQPRSRPGSAQRQRPAKPQDSVNSQWYYISLTGVRPS